MKTKIKFLTILVAVLFAVSILAACDQTPATSETSVPVSSNGETTGGGGHEELENPNVSIVYWQSMNAYKNQTSQNENVYDPILDAVAPFEEKYGGTVTVNAVNWGDMLSTMTQMQNAGEAPDMVMVYDRTMHPVVLNNFVMDISDYITDDDFSFWPISRDLFSWKGGTYAIPIKPYLYYIMFNRDMFEMEGLEYPDELFRKGEWTFEKFDEVGRALTRRVDGEMIQYAFTSWTEIFSAFIISNGGRIVDVDTSTGTATSGLSSTATQNAMYWISRWVDNTTGIIYIADNDFGGFDSNRVAMNRGKEFPVEVPFEVGMVPLPAGPDAPDKTIYVYPQALAVPVGASNPAGAAAYVYFLNQRQQEVGDPKEANRIGQENYDMIYNSNANFVYAYDKAVDAYDEIEATLINNLSEGVPPATAVESVEAQLQAAIEKLYN